MKKIKFLLLLLTVTATIFYSCTDNNPVENEAVAQKSIALRSALNYFKTADNPSGKNSTKTFDQALCFNFVYPITLEYNNGTQISVADLEGLLQTVFNENGNLFIDGIVFPFQVQEEGVITTINDEAEFFALLQGCDAIHIVNSFVFDLSCYSIVFPVQIVNANNETISITSQAELLQYAAVGPAGTIGYQLNLVFPISVIQNNQTIVINNIYEFFELNNDCGPNDCVCLLVYDPVCVYTGNGVVEYSNACFAECDGFTSADFTECGIIPQLPFNLLLGNCFSIEFPVQIQSQGALVTANSNGEILQYWNPVQSDYPAFNYPITVHFSNGVSVTVNSQSSFQSLVAQHCN